MMKQAPWISKSIKSALRKKSRLTKRCYVNGQVQGDYKVLLIHSKNFTELIFSTKNDYMLTMRKKLNCPSTAPKSYWPILK